MDPNELTSRLKNSLQVISDLLRSLSADDWQRPQGDKWTIVQEFEHLYLSTQATAFVLSPVARPRWHSFAGESRSFETLVDQYQTRLAATANINNAATRPTDGAGLITVEQQAENWNKVMQELLHVIGGLSATDLDAYTVWKHPLLGPLTVREIIYFTAHHTDHHHASLRRKQIATAV